MEHKVTSLTGATAAKAKVDAQVDQMSEIYRFSKAELDRLKVLYQGSKNTQVLKVFRDLRTQLYGKVKGNNFSCMFTSVVPGGGSSFVVKNLGAAISLDRTRTSLIVDCNFYKPSLESLIVTDSEEGLTDFLDNDDMGVESIVHASGIPRLRVVPVGNNTEGAAERLSSVRMKAFVKELKARYPDRYILLDAPSIGEYSAEVRILAGMCDFVVLVVPYGLATANDIKNALDVLGNRVACVVYNRWTNRI